ncbi:MAG TPA: hypothetical protein VF323_13000 [Candidatus Limnocylindrales bacterium]
MKRLPALRVLLAVVVVAVAVGAPVAWWFTREAVTCGIVVGIDQASITDVRGFTLRTSDGITSSYVVVPARLAPDSFVPGHLREHRALATPVCVTFRPAESPAVALDLTDAPAP